MNVFCLISTSSPEAQSQVDTPIVLKMDSSFVAVSANGNPGNCVHHQEEGQGRQADEGNAAFCEPFLEITCRNTNKHTGSRKHVCSTPRKPVLLR